MPDATLLDGPSYGGLFVLLAFLLALGGAVAAHVARARARNLTGVARLGWAACTGLAFGGGTIWSAQVVETLGRGPGVGVAFRPPIAAGCLSAACTGAVGGVAVLRRDPADPRRLGLAGAVVGGGAWIAGVARPAGIDFSTADGVHVLPAVVALVLAVVAGGVWLWGLFHARGAVMVSAAAAISAAAWSGAHLAAATSIRFTADPAGAAGRGHLEDGFGLGAVVAFGSAIVMIFIMFAAATGSRAPQQVVAPYPRSEPRPPGSEPAGPPSRGPRLVPARPAPASGDTSFSETDTVELPLGRARPVIPPSRLANPSRGRRWHRVRPYA